MIEKLTCKQYADKRNISKQAVAKAIRKGHKLPGVIATEVIGKQYTLTVDTTALTVN